jgi:hypothetical protein
MNWKQEIKTETEYKVFETLMDAGAELETVLNTIKFTIPSEKQQKELLKIIEDQGIYHPNVMILTALEISERDNPELYEILLEEYT